MGAARRVALLAASAAPAAAAGELPAAAAAQPPLPDPFDAVLSAAAAPLPRGNDVTVLQHLVARSPFVAAAPAADGVYGARTAAAVAAFQRGNGLAADGVVGRATAAALLRLHGADGYADAGRPAADYGEQYLYKILIPVHRNRSVETTATLLDARNAPLLTFPVRAKGHEADADGKAVHGAPWPDWSSAGVGLNAFSRYGMTPTGLTQIDPNGPEGNDTLYGPYPVTRFVQGLEGNAAFLVPTIRNGILIHTGQWPGWEEGDPMPNSAGCVHTWPRKNEALWHAVTSLGVAVRNNTDGALPYPYRSQGLASVFTVS